MKPVTSARADGRVRVATYDKYLRCIMFFVLALNGTIASFYSGRYEVLNEHMVGYLAGQYASQLGNSEVESFRHL